LVSDWSSDVCSSDLLGGLGLAAALDPRSPAAQMLLGRVLWARGESKPAQEAFEAALKLDPKSVDSLLSLGALMAARSPAKARELLLGFLKENPAQAAEIRLQLAKIELDGRRL